MVCFKTLQTEACSHQSFLVPPVSVQNILNCPLSPNSASFCPGQSKNIFIEQNFRTRRHRNIYIRVQFSPFENTHNGIMTTSVSVIRLYCLSRLKSCLKTNFRPSWSGYRDWEIAYSTTTPRWGRTCTPPAGCVSRPSRAGGQTVPPGSACIGSPEQ